MVAHCHRRTAGIRTALAPLPRGGWGRSLFPQSVDSAGGDRSHKHAQLLSPAESTSMLRV